MLSYQQAESTKQRSFIADNYRIEEQEAVRTISRQQLLNHNDLQGRALTDVIFPSTFYAGNYIAPEKNAPFPLSPRQEEAIERLKPHQAIRDIPIAQKPLRDTSPRPKMGSATTAFRPSESSQQRPSSAASTDFPSLHKAGPNSPRIPQDYAHMVVAKPNKDVKYGDYPELKSVAVRNFGSEPGKFSATVNVQNAQNKQENFDQFPPPPHEASDGYIWIYAEEPTTPSSPAPPPEPAEEPQPNVTMETKVSGAQPKRVGKWTLAQLRQTDGIIPSQAGWNRGDSQKLMTNFGTPRNTQLRIKSENLQEIPEEVALKAHGEVRLQSGTNKFASQKLMTNFGTGRDVCRESNYVNQLPADLEPLPEEKIRLSDGIVRLQSGTNKYASQKQMMSFGTNRRETTKMIDTKHPEYDHEKPDQAEIPLQSGTNKFASQKGMMSFGTNRRETTKMLDTSHPDYDHTQSIDQTQIPYQMGSNQYASQKGMTSFGQPRWEVLDPSISWQNRKSQGMVRLQSGTNRFASQAGWWGSSGFGTPRNNTYEAEGGELPYEDMKKSESIIPSQAGWNKGDSQKLMTSFGSPRDVRGKHLKRLWELEYPEEAEIPLDRL